MSKVTDKELSMVKVCLGQTSQLFTVLVLSVSTGDVPRHVAQAGGWAVRQMASARLCSGKNIIQL